MSQIINIWMLSYDYYYYYYVYTFEKNIVYQ